MLRLHAEKQVLSSVIRNILRKNINPARETNASTKLQTYLNVSTSRVKALRKHGFNLAEIDVETLAPILEDQMTPGEYDNLIGALKNLDLRKNIIHKTKSEAAQSIDRVTLKNRIVEAFSLDEINSMLFELNIDNENFSQKKEQLVIDLIKFLERRNNMSKLVNWIEKNRKDVLADA